MDTDSLEMNIVQDNHLLINELVKQTCVHIMDNVLHYGQANMCSHSTPQSQTCVPLKGSEAKCVHPHALVQQQAIEKHPCNSEQA